MAAAMSVLLAADDGADAAVGSVRDRMWNALGRPQSHEAMDAVFPGGIGTYTSGDPRGQPLLMSVLRSRILSTSVPSWTETARQGWRTRWRPAA